MIKQTIITFWPTILTKGAGNYGIPGLEIAYTVKTSEAVIDGLNICCMILIN